MPIGASEDATREGRRARDRGRDAGVRTIGERVRSGDARGWEPSDGRGAHGARGASAHLLGVVACPGAESERGSRNLRRSRLRAEEGDEALLPHGVVVRRDPRRDRHGVARGGGGAPATGASRSAETSQRPDLEPTACEGAVCIMLISRARVVDRRCLKRPGDRMPRARSFYFSPAARLSLPLGCRSPFLAAAPSRRGGCRFWRASSPRGRPSRGRPRRTSSRSATSALGTRRPRARGTRTSPPRTSA
jgi:hypothetical protein